MIIKNGVGLIFNWIESDRVNGKVNVVVVLFVISFVNKLVIINKIVSNICGL